VEDLAYCLLGIFDVNMPLLYGEGMRAFIRLQEEIIRISDDESIFVWSVDDPQEEHLLVKKLQDQIRHCGDDIHIFVQPSEDTGAGNLLAPRPSCFASCGAVQRDVFAWRPPYSVTNKGLEIAVQLIEEPRSLGIKKYLIPLNCTQDGIRPLAMSLGNPLGLVWVRCGCKEMMGDVESLFKVLDTQDGREIIHISARWPCHPVHNLARLRPEVVGGGEIRWVIQTSAQKP
jgi:hypothetical protein